LLDYLTPKEVWDNLKFRDLKEQNIIEGSQPTGFFQWALAAKVRNERFSLVMGNPPFNPEKGVSKESVLNPIMIANLGLRHSIPRKNLALHFFEASMLLADKVCMIIPSNVLLYDKSAKTYRKDIFTNYTISDIFDFTHLRRELFSSVDTPVVAVLATQKPSDQSPINHTVVKRTISFERKVSFEIDHYDRHTVKWDWAVDPEKQFVWKTNLLGGGRLFHMVNKFSSLRTLKEFISQNEPKWIYKSGYKVGGNTKKNLASFMAEGDEICRINEDGDFEISSNNEPKTTLVEYFPNPKVYTTPLLVIDQVLGERKIPVALIKGYKKEYLYFNRDFIGIHAPLENFDQLEVIYDLIRSDLKDFYRLYVVCQSGSALVLTETEINKRDIDALPFPEDLSLLSRSESELMIEKDVMNYQIHLGKAISKDASRLHQGAEEPHLSEN